MANIETIPAKFSQPFDPLETVDHELIALYARGRILGGEGPRRELQQVYTFFLNSQPKLLEWVINKGKFVEPYDDDLKTTDGELMRLKTFNSGAALALQALTVMAYEANVGQKVWQDVWANMPDFPFEENLELSTPAHCHKLGAAILRHGANWLAEAPSPYRELVDDVLSKHTGVTEHANIFKASFGYIYGNGYAVVSNLIYDRELEVELLKSRVTPGQLDQDLKRLVRTERKLEKIRRKASTT